MEVLLKSTALLLPTCMYSILFFKCRFPQETKLSLVLAKELVEDLARVVYTTTKFSRDFDKVEDLVRSLPISLKILEREVLAYSQGKLEKFTGNEIIKIHINFNLSAL